MVLQLLTLAGDNGSEMTDGTGDGYILRLQLVELGNGVAEWNTK